MDKSELLELLRYSTSNELFIVDYNNQLKLLKCPFMVSVLVNIGTLKRGQMVLVDQVKITSKLINVYVINGKPYYYFHFEIEHV